MSIPRANEMAERSGDAPTRDSIQMLLARDHERLERLFRAMLYAMDSTDPADLRGAWMTLESEVERHLDAEEKQILLPMKARFDRRGFGLRWNQDLDVGGVVVGDQVEVTAHVELIRAGAPR